MNTFSRFTFELAREDADGSSDGMLWVQTFTLRHGSAFDTSVAEIPCYDGSGTDDFLMRFANTGQVNGALKSVTFARPGFSHVSDEPLLVPVRFCSPEKVRALHRGAGLHCAAAFRSWQITAAPGRDQFHIFLTPDQSVVRVESSPLRGPQVGQVPFSTNKESVMIVRVSILMAIWLCLAPGEAQAQSVLDKYLKKSTQGNAGQSGGAGEAAINKVFEGTTGYWRLDDSRSVGGFCAITYYASPYYAGYVGPVGNSSDSFILFSGPTIPPIKKGKNKKMTLTSADGVAQTVPAFHAPNPEQPDGGLVIFKLTDIKAAMDEMSDEENLTIGLKKKQVFSIKWEGGHTARAAMQKCLASTAPQAGAK